MRKYGRWPRLLPTSSTIALPVADQSGRAGAATAMGVNQQPDFGEQRGRIHARPVVDARARFGCRSAAVATGALVIPDHPDSRRCFATRLSENSRVVGGITSIGPDFGRGMGPHH